MNKILVMDVSAGVGKSTFAKRLGKHLNIHVCHLDQLFWEPGWIVTAHENFTNKQKQVMNQYSEWIIEGNYTGTYNVRSEHANTIIYLQLSIFVCLYRVVKRWWTYRGHTREDMGEGCPEKLDWEFIKFIIFTYRRRKKTMVIRLKEFVDRCDGNKVYFLRGKKEIRTFLETGYLQLFDNLPSRKP